MIEMAKGIINAFGYSHDFRASDERWELAIGCAICAA